MSVYVPKHFAVGDGDAALRLMHEHPFATLITATAAEPHVSHVPLLFDASGSARGTLIGHFARANPHAAAASNRPSVAIFHGPHAYVSPSFYAEPASAVPTWNYAVVHAHGVVELADERETQAVVERLVERFESSRAKPWRIGLEGAKLAAMIRAIVGFRMRVERLDVKFKLSQNRSDDDRRRVIDALAGERYAEADATAAWMRAYADPDAGSR